MIGWLALAFVLGLAFAGVGFAAPSPRKAAARRLAAVRARHRADVAEAGVRRALTQEASRLDDLFHRLLPRPALLRRRLEMTGKGWTLGRYASICAGLALSLFVMLAAQGLPLLLSLLLGLLAGVGLPHLIVGKLIARRIAAFTARFPDAIDLLVRGLRSGLPIGETMGVVSTEIPGPVGEEFRAVVDRMKIGRTMDQALQESAETLGTAEFQFFVIALAIQRETGGNLAETLGNLADVLRKRGQMKLKVKAMSSESKASAWIIGVLPLLVFCLISFINPGYMHAFFSDPRLIATALGGACWMGIGVFIMAKMINFEI